MEDFSFLTDSEDEREVKEVISQAMDHSVLEQVAAINCSSFPSDSDLPPDLHTRFQKLKSFPITNNKNSISSTSNNSLFKTKSLKPQFDENVLNSPKKETEAEFRFSLSKSSDSPTGILKSQSKCGIGEFGSPSSTTDSYSPPRRIGCFWCSPKKVNRKKCKENRIEIDWGKEDVEILPKFFTKERKKILKKAMKEEEKINREAEKIVKWAKQASARMMDVSATSGLELEDEEMSENEFTK